MPLPKSFKGSHSFSFIRSYPELVEITQFFKVSNRKQPSTSIFSKKRCNFIGSKRILEAMKTTVSQSLKQEMKPGRVYRRQELNSFSNNLTRDLERLVANKEIVRAGPGLYYLPEMTKVGPLPASPAELVRAFLNDGDFLLTSLDDYNPLGLGLTQLYNETIVYNRKRHGRFVLDGRRFSFRRPRNFPRELSKEFLYVDVLNNKKELLEDTSRLAMLLTNQSMKLDPKKLLEAANTYGKVSTRKFFEELIRV